MFAPAIGPAIRSAISPAINRAALPAAFAELNLLAPTLDPRITFTRSSTKTYIGADGLLHTAAVNECPLEYDPVTLQPVGMSFWEARTNSCLWSEDRTHWSTQQASLSAGPAFPLDPGKTMTRITAAGDAAAIIATAVSAGLQYAVTAYVRRDQHRYCKLFGFGNGPAGAVVDLQTGATQLNGGWDTVSVEMLTSTIARVCGVLKPVTQSGQVFIGPTGAMNGSAPANGVFLDVIGVGVELGATPGPYIPTAGSQVTRAADVATVNDLSTLRFNAAESTWFVEAYAPPARPITYARLLALGSTGQHLMGTSPNTGHLLEADGTNLYSGNEFNWGQINKAAVVVDTNMRSVCLNGQAVVSAAVTGAFDYSRLLIGSAGSSGSAWNAPIRRIRYYPRRLTDSELRALTT